MLRRGLLACLLAVVGQVNAAGPPAPGLSVQVTNSVLPVQITNTTPLTVTTTSKPLELYSERDVTGVSGVAVDGELTFDVPDGKRLVIETVSLVAILPVGQSAWFELRD